MTTAKLIKEEVSEVGAIQRLYELSKPIGYDYDYDKEKDTQLTNFILVSGTYAMFSGEETYIFPADKDGNVLDWGELDGSFRGSIDHEQALENAGYELT